MKTYIFKVIQSSPLRGYNREIIVYRIKNNQPLFIGSDNKVNTASYKGDYAIACNVLKAVEGYKMTKCGYYLQTNKVKLLEI